MNGLELLIDELKKEVETRASALAHTMLSDYAIYSKKFIELQTYRAVLEMARDLYQRMLDTGD